MGREGGGETETMELEGLRRKRKKQRKRARFTGWEPESYEEVRSRVGTVYSKEGKEKD